MLNTSNLKKKADLGHPNFIDALKRVQHILMESNTSVSGSLSPSQPVVKAPTTGTITSDLGTLALGDGVPATLADVSTDSPKPPSTAPVTTEPFDWKRTSNDKSQAMTALEGLLVMLKGLEREIRTLWESYRDGQIQLTTAMSFRYHNYIQSFRFKTCSSLPALECNRCDQVRQGLSDVEPS